MARVYISAPFRVHSSDMQGREYGLLDNESYRGFLESVEREIRKLGLDVCLPHRDKGHWGHTYITPEEITRICFDLIQSSDILVIFPGRSRGVHIEIGYAAALRKKLLVFLSDDEKESTLLRGISRETYMAVFRYTSQQDIRKVLHSQLPKLAASVASQQKKGGSAWN